MTLRDQMEKRTPSSSTAFDYRDYRFTFVVGLLAGTFILAPVGSDILNSFGDSSHENAAIPEEQAVDASRDENIDGDSTLTQALEETTTSSAIEDTPQNQLFSGKIEVNQFVADILTNAGASLVDADSAVRSLTGIYDFRKSRPGHQYEFELAPDGKLLWFRYKASADEIFITRRNEEDKFSGSAEEITLEREVVEVNGAVEVSLWEAFVRSGESPNLAMTLAEVFQFDIDFFHDTRKGDRFRFWVEKFTNEGELVRYGRIYAAEYVGASDSPVGTKRLFYWDSKRDLKKGYYDSNGKAAQRAFLRSPLSFTRISSPFGYRKHPILKKRHFHGGVDYAAPTGTPVRAVAEGRVVFAARKGPAGKMVRIRHDGGYESFYLHLSKIKVRVGQRVSQSTIIGNVGSTGRSTGPHLDFRLKKHGKYLNPRRHVAPRTKSVPRKELKSFKQSITKWTAKFAI